MTDLIVYYGTTMPHPERARSVANTDIVLQPYHPIVAQGEYRRTFPDARRFVYVNPTSIDPWRLERLSTRPPLLDIADEWSLPRLDLTTSAGWRAAIDEAAWALATGPDHIDGIFIDDLDRVDASTAHAFVAELHDALGWTPALFVNRGFHAWSGLLVDAVLIEDVRGGDVPDGDPAGLTRWIEESVIPSLIDVRNRGSAVHRIEYLDTSERRDDTEPQLPPGFFDSMWMSAPRSLNDWPTKLTMNKELTR